MPHCTELLFLVFLKRETLTAVETQACAVAVHFVTSFSTKYC